MSEVVREMTVKSGQKCTAIRRVFVPHALYDAVAQAIGAKLAKTSVGNPRNEAVRMGALVSQEQKASVIEGMAKLRTEAEVLFDGGSAALGGCRRVLCLCGAGAAGLARAGQGESCCTRWKCSARWPRSWRTTASIRPMN